MNRQPVRGVRRDTDINIRDRYQQAYKRYVSCQFTYNSHCLLRKLCENGHKQPKMLGVPLSKLMYQITKIMMMNELELLFFGATVQDMQWKVIQNCLTPYINQVTDITPKIQKDQYVKKMQLSLLLIAYIVKIYLNEDSSLYDFKIRDLIKSNFDKMYQQWVQKVQNNFKFSPKHMNKLFKQLDKGKHKVKQQIKDYNRLVYQLFKNNGDQKRMGEISELHQWNIRPQKQRQKQQYHLHNHHQHGPSNSRIQGLPVHQQQDQYRLPSLNERGVSNRSQISGFGKRQSYHELFEKGQLKQQRSISMPKIFSQDQDDFNGSNI